MGKKRGNKRNANPLTLENEGATSSNPAVPKSDTLPRTKDEIKESKIRKSDQSDLKLGKSDQSDLKLGEGGNEPQGLRSLSLDSSNASKF